MRVIAAPAKANAPLVIDANAVLTLALAFQCLKSIRRRNSKIVQRRRVVEHAQLATSNRLDVRRQSPRGRSSPDCPRFPVGEICNHARSITRSVIWRNALFEASPDGSFGCGCGNNGDTHNLDLDRGHEECVAFDDPRRRFSNEVDEESSSAPVQIARCDYAKPLAINEDIGKCRIGLDLKEEPADQVN